jgi:hypothetical protein
MEYLTTELYVVAGKFSVCPWHAKVFTSFEEANAFWNKQIEFKSVLKIMKLKDYMWQLSNPGKESPRSIQGTEND